MSGYSFVPAPKLEEFTDEQRIERAKEFYQELQNRRSLRDFSGEPIPADVIRHCLLSAGTAPNGANLQPWHFCAISDPAIKKEIREGAEEEEREFYSSRAPQTWLDALHPLGTDENKPFLEIAPWLIVVFAQAHRINEAGERQKNYYVSESVGIATGFLVNALHNCGLATLTHTPSPMKFLNKILGRPDNERPYLILVTGHPAEGAQVPELTKFPLDEIASFFE